MLLTNIPIKVIPCAQKLLLFAAINISCRSELFKLYFSIGEKY